MSNPVAARSMNLVIMFALLSAVAVTLTATTMIMKVGTESLRGLSEKSRVTTMDLAAVLGDPFAMGEYDHMAQIITAAQKADPDLKYAIILSSDGRVVASTDPSLKDKKLDTKAEDKSALAATDYLNRETMGNGGGNMFEAVMPIKTMAGSAGVLRMGFTAQRAEADTNGATSFVCLIAFVSVLATTLVFAVLVRKWVPATTPTQS